MERKRQVHAFDGRDAPSAKLAESEIRDLEMESGSDLKLPFAEMNIYHLLFLLVFQGFGTGQIYICSRGLKANGSRSSRGWVQIWRCEISKGPNRRSWCPRRIPGVEVDLGLMEPWSPSEVGRVDSRFCAVLVKKA